MPKSLLLFFSLVLASCSSSGDGGGITPSTECSNDEQKTFVRDAMQDWYLWNDLLPNPISIDNYATPEAMLADLITYSPDDGSGEPIDKFSFIGSAAADAAFFEEGQYEGFGFSSHFVAADDLRLTQVYADSPVGLDGRFARGQQILELDGRTIAEIEAAEGINAIFNMSPLTFTMLEPGGAQFMAIISHGIVTINPVPQWNVIPAGDGSGRMVGYIELSTFISTAEPKFDTAFAEFNANNVNDVIIDLRYNGGGLVNTAELLGDFLGGIVAIGDVFSETRFNADRAPVNNRFEFFNFLNNSINLSRLVVIATAGTASASELVTNSMAPHVEVTIVGDSTFGKPVGQAGFEFCEKILRPTAFQTVNSDGFGDYFDGLPVTCAAEDDLNVPIGDVADPNMVAAMSFLDTGQCPGAAPATGASKAQLKVSVPQVDRRGPPWREFAGAY